MRRSVASPATMFDKVWRAHEVATLDDGASLLFVDRHLIHDLEPVLDGVVMMRRGRVALAGQVDDLRAEHGKSIDQLFREVYR